jgi:hypothetical protein
MAAKESAVKEVKQSALEALMDAELKVTGADIPDGSYAAMLFEFSEPWSMDATKSKFYKDGDDKLKTVFHASFGLIDKAGILQRLDYMMPWPDGGGANRRSNFYKVLKNISVGKNLIKEDGNFAKGTKLSSFVGLTCMLGVKKNAKEFPQVDSVIAPVEGLKYPTLAACKDLPKNEMSHGSDDVPF